MMSISTDIRKFGFFIITAAIPFICPINSYAEGKYCIDFYEWLDSTAQNTFIGTTNANNTNSSVYYPQSYVELTCDLTPIVKNGVTYYPTERVLFRLSGRYLASTGAIESKTWALSGTVPSAAYLNGSWLASATPARIITGMTNSSTGVAYIDAQLETTSIHCTGSEILYIYRNW